jgi:hypothetical protein
LAKADAGGTISVRTTEIAHDKAGNDKDVCAKEAKAARTPPHTRATPRCRGVGGAPAEDQPKRKRTALHENHPADRRHKSARGPDKRDAGYAVAKEKGDSLQDACEGGLHERRRSPERTASFESVSRDRC